MVDPLRQGVLCVSGGCMAVYKGLLLPVLIQFKDLSCQNLALIIEIIRFSLTITQWSLTRVDHEMTHYRDIHPFFQGLKGFIYSMRPLWSHSECIYMFL